MPERRVVTISGDLGSGKSTVAHTLARLLGMRRYSTGDLQRSLAAELGVTSLELNKRAETDRTIDDRIDASTVELAAREPQIVFDSRLAWHFVPESLKVSLTVDPAIGAFRIYSAGRGQVEQYPSFEVALQKVQERRDSEAKRYMELYGVNPQRLENYDLVVDTSLISPDRVAEIVIDGLKAREERRGFAPVWLSPRTPLPTVSSAAESPRNDVRLAASVAASCAPVCLLRAGGYYFIYDDAILPESHSGVIACLEAGDDAMPARAAFSDHDLLPNGSTVQHFVETGCRDETVLAWERRFGYRFPSYPPSLSLKAAPPE